jgi:4-methyl-5(b-hydroxyethyl)-thiazole monophosphate biosynthesis
MKTPTALVIVVDGVEELEAVAPIDLLRRAEVAVTVAAAGESREITGRNAIRMCADRLLSEVAAEPFDLVVIPGGPGHVTLLADATVLGLLARQHARAALVGSICAGPLVLNEAGILKGRRFTSFPGTAGQLPGRDPASPVVRDGNIITSQAAGTATAFGLALVEALCGPDKRAGIAASICA